MSGAFGAERKGTLLRALFGVLKSDPDGISAKTAIDTTRAKVDLLPEELGNYGDGAEKFPKLLRFATIPTVKAGWLVKDDGVWSLSETGLKALDSYPNPEAFYNEAWKLYTSWKKEADSSVHEDSADETNVAMAVSLEEAEDVARAEILEYMGEMPPFDFQHICAKLVQALGHEINWISDPGPDGGIDFVAYADPIGAKGRRIKGQAKRVQNKQDVDDVGAFLSKLKVDDVGVYMALGGFTKPAGALSRADERRLVLIDGPEFLRLWITHYGRLDEEARDLLQLEPIYHLVSPAP